jgi:hypothetical protein
MTDNKNDTAGAVAAPEGIPAKPVEMSAFFTREKANSGIKIPLYLPDNTDSGHWVRLLGVDADVFRKTHNTEMRKVAEIVQLKDMAEREEAIEESKRRLLACLVTSWSFPQECTQENVMNFLREAPHIADAIDRVSNKRSLFFGAGSSSSAPTQSTSSDST